MSNPACVRLILAILLSVGCGSAGRAAGIAERGAALAQGWCSQCHAIAPGHPSPDAKAPTFPAIAAELTATDYALHVFLRTPHATMPNFRITAVDIDDLVAYITSMKR